MEPYLFHEVVLPERAPLSLGVALEFTHAGSGFAGEAKVSIVLNQVVVWVESEHDWDIFDLRNVVKHIVRGELAMVGYLKGYAYEFEITRVLNRSRGIDYVFGIDVPCIAERSQSVDLPEALSRLREEANGPNGVFLRRCFADLASSMKDADDTGFYCYRAIESLRHHCAAVHDLPATDTSKQWEKFREVAGRDQETLLYIKAAADPLRHGGVTGISAEERGTLLASTWDVVDGYLNGISPDVTVAVGSPAETKGPTE
jgi:hypothetical protein